MFNNKGPEPLTVNPVFYSLSGVRLDLPVMMIPAKSFQEVDLRVLLANYLLQYDEGSLQVSHQGGRLQLGAQFKILKNGMLFDEQFIQPASRFPSNRLESVWWKPSNQTDTKFILSNTTDLVVTATVGVEGTAPHQSQPATIYLNPHETRVLDILQDLVGQQNGGVIKKEGGISITHNGGAGALMARILVSDAGDGYSSVANFTDPTTALSSKFNGGGLRIGAIGNDQLNPIVVARNIGTTTTTVSGQIPYTNANGEVAFVQIPATQIDAGESKSINLKPAIQAANLPSNVTFAGINLEYSTAPGTVLMNALSVSQSGQQVFQVPLLDPMRLPSSAGGFPWKVDGDYTTVIFIKNESNIPKKYVAYLNYEGGGYSLGEREVKPFQTVMIDFKTLRDSQTPDGMGNLIPPNMDSGQASWTMFGADSNKQMTGRSEQVNTVTGIASTYACYNCCPDNRSTIGVLPGSALVTVGGYLQLQVLTQTTTCYGQQGEPFPRYVAGWANSNPQIGTITNDGLAEAISPGIVSFSTDWIDITWFDAGINNCWMSENPGAGSGEMVVTPTVTNVTANGATKITQITGDANIIHFVTPKGGTNDQVTLTATLSESTQAILDDISWEGATESANNPLQATVSKSSASRETVKIKYRNNVIKELRVWIVWATVTVTETFQITAITGNTGRPAGPGQGIEGGYTFRHTIQPATIITDANRPNLSGANVNSPPGGNHPINGDTLANGANKKWDGSRQIRFKILNPNTISPNDTSFVLTGFPSDLEAYPTNDVIGNDDRSALDEMNDPYSQSQIGTLLAQDIPNTVICNRAGADGNTFESRLQFREFTRLEIEGTWVRISDFFLWKFHRRLHKVNGVWVDNSSVLALNNGNF